MRNLTKQRQLIAESSQSHTTKVEPLTAAEQINRLSESNKDLLLKSLFE
ncbi:hypothetical protein Xbud_02971 [Xenorhabdus budapestensis]|uniref:Uncharacterized protein n=1 Tax=Xenorhabdus budapestensis TaxID=290110 RepID=A0A2D0IU57_XENBU|nr:hypothetical protein Xbud_02971 [Xenorhabdus budapestensis]